MQAETRPCLLCMFDRSLFDKKKEVKVHNIKCDTVEIMWNIPLLN